MAGKPGSGGPVPKRSDQRRRRNKPDVPITQAAGAAVVPVPSVDESWHPIARDWFVSLGSSGQSAFYEPSDWQVARYVAQAMSENLSAGRFSAQLFAAVMAASTSLLVTEGDRRRLRLELSRRETVDPDAERADATVTDLMSRLGG